MTFIFILIFIILTASFYYIYSLLVKNKNYKKQIIYLSKQNSQLKNKLLEFSGPNMPDIIYQDPEYKFGITIENYTSMYIAPTTCFGKITSLKKDTKVDILDEAIVNKFTWLYVSINEPSNLNNKGWIQKQNVELLSNKISAI